MEALRSNRWIQLAAIGVVMALLGLIVSVMMFSADSSGPTLGPVKLITGGTARATGSSFLGSSSSIQRAGDIVEEELPLTAAEAVAAGWKDPILCSTGRGRYFQKTGGEEVPYLLMYDAADQLTGMYMVSETEMPAPWERTEEILGGAGPVIDYEHWGLFIYFRDPTQACEITQGSGGYYR